MIMKDIHSEDPKDAAQAAETLPDHVDIIGISFRNAGKVYYFASNGVVAAEGDHAIVETARGQEYGIVSLSNRLVPKTELVLPLRKVLRLACKEDEKRYQLNRKKEEEAFRICQEKIAAHKLDMKLIDVEYTFDNSKLLFYFTSDDRVDFRELVKDLASVFRTRIELRQIGIRDEAKLMGGLGVCGREFCCHSFLSDFTQVTIKMAKEQSLSLNSAKISGACGKLMCCLRYEHEAYQEEFKLTPQADTPVLTPDGPGVVMDAKPLQGLVRVKLESGGDESVRTYHRDLLKPYDRTANPSEAKPTRPDTLTRSEAVEKKQERRPERNVRPERPSEKNTEGGPSRKNDKKSPSPSDKQTKRPERTAERQQRKPERRFERPRDNSRPENQSEKRQDTQEKKPQKNAKKD